MRIAHSLPLALAAAGLLTACGPSTTTRQVGSTPPVVTPPTVTYQVIGTDLTEANANAIAFCRQYGMGALSQGVTVRGSDNLATYSCSGQIAVGAMATVPAPMVVAPAQPGTIVVAPMR